jgi:beta-1,4-mannosyl-glycoprotein beta-1,4-N-acetylglucosaminyltransferase
MKIVDCFIFYNEVDMLVYRLNVLNHIVDWFVLVESRHTHTGKEKECTYELNKNSDALVKFREKIVHIIVDDFPFKYPNINCAKREQWANEQFQRICIERGLNKLCLEPDDIFTIADLDEIPDPKTLAKVKAREIQVTANSLEMDLYYYNLNTKFEAKWTFPKILSYGVFIQNKQVCEAYRYMICPVIPNGGWHLSYFGDAYFIQNKLFSFAHQEFNTFEYTSLSNIEQRVNSSIDLFGRENKIVKLSSYHNDYLPVECMKYLRKYILY